MFDKITSYERGDTLSLPRHCIVRLTLKPLPLGEEQKFFGANLRKGGLHLWSSPLFFG
jgi:hypothetical protein